MYFYFCDTWCHKSRSEVCGNPPQTEKPRSQGAWPLNPVDVRGVKRWTRALAGPGGPLDEPSGWPRMLAKKKKKKKIYKILFQKYYISPCGTQFLINKQKNRGRVLFTGASVKSSLRGFKRLPGAGLGSGRWGP
jgi:hypothetical protein